MLRVFFSYFGYNSLFCFGFFFSKEIRDVHEPAEQVKDTEKKNWSKRIIKMRKQKWPGWVTWMNLDTVCYKTDLLEMEAPVVSG